MKIYIVQIVFRETNREWKEIYFPSEEQARKYINTLKHKKKYTKLVRKGMLEIYLDSIKLFPEVEKKGKITPKDKSVQIKNKLFPQGLDKTFYRVKEEKEGKTITYQKTTLGQQGRSYSMVWKDRFLSCWTNEKYKRHGRQIIEDKD
jgi:hypothetical protein